MCCPSSNDHPVHLVTEAGPRGIHEVIPLRASLPPLWPRIAQRLIDDATAQGWPREIERHEATKRRLEQLLPGAYRLRRNARECRGQSVHGHA